MTSSRINKRNWKSQQGSQILPLTMADVSVTLDQALCDLRSCAGNSGCFHHIWKTVMMVKKSLNSVVSLCFTPDMCFNSIYCPRDTMPSLAGNQDVPSTFSFESVEDVKVVEFCPFGNAAGLVAYGGANRVSVGICLFQEEAQDSHLPLLQFQHITDFHHGTPTHSLAWSPKTNIQHLPYSFQFCTAGEDKKLRYFVSDGRNSSSVTILEGHLSYINDCIIEPISGLEVASVSDDHTCRLWDLETGTQKSCIPLSSAGVSVKWHHKEPNKLMVAQKNGLVRFYDLVSQQPIMSISTGQVPLMSVDWCTNNTLRVGAVARDDWLIWDMSKSSLPEVIEQAHPGGVCKFRWSNVHENLFATTGHPGNHINVYHMEHHKMPVSCQMPTGGGVSWHPSLPVCASGGGNKVHLWFLEV